jgi:signal transduction histidine kinase
MIWDRVMRFLEDGQYQPDDGLIYWRERIIKSIYLIVIIFGLPTYIFSMYQASVNNLYSLIIINTIVYFVIIILFLVKSISLYVKGFTIIILAYIVGINLIINVGPEANGLIYFIAASVLSSLLVGVRGSIVSLTVNVIIFILFAIGLHYNILMNYDVSKYSVNIWIITSSTTELICLVSSIPLAISLNGLDGIIIRQKSLQAQLKEKANLFSKAKQKAEEADNLKTKFLANMSHEVRTPLNAIMGFTELLMYKAYSNSEEETRYLNTIHSSGTYLLNIIKNILDFSIIESGQLKLNIKPFLLDDIISYLNSMYSLSVKKNSTVNVLFKRPETDEKFSANSDTDRIKQVLINLINNALKNQDKGIIEVGYAKKDTMFEFYVADEGIGIPFEAQKTIFKRFVKVEGKDKVREGTGLGLPISKGIINALGGDIWVESKVGKGSIFYFTIPTNR